jgi:hypothetical protein
MLRRSLLFLLAALLAGALHASAFAAPVFPPGLPVGLEPAPGLSVSHHFPGFEDIDRHVQVAITSLPLAAYEKMRTTLAKDRSAEGGPHEESFRFAGGAGFLVSGAVKDKGVPVHRWFLLTPPTDKEAGPAMLIRVEVPDTARAAYPDAAVRKMLASVTLRKVPTKELLGLLPFKLTDLAGFRVAKVAPGTVVLTDGPSDNLTNEPHVVVFVGRGAPADKDRARFAHDILTTAPVLNLAITSGEPMRIKSLPGYEIRAKAEDRQGHPLKVVQWIRFGTAGFLGVIGVTPDKKWDAVFNRFRALRDGVAGR